MILLGYVAIVDHLMSDPPNWPHPVRFIGWSIRFYEKLVRMKIQNLYIGGFVLLIATVASFLGPIALLSRVLHPTFFKFIEFYLLYALLATQCLADEGKRIVNILHRENIEESRRALSYLVGRDTTLLEEEDIVKGACETISENTIDGTIAPLFYMAIGILLGMPLMPLIIYKCVNTLDSMVGYLQAPYKEIGFASAKLDDALNYIPARVGAIIMIGASALIKLDWKQGIKILKRDRRNHKSPNCGYPESVTAGALGIRLGGTHVYFGERVYKPTIGDVVMTPNTKHIDLCVQMLIISQWLFIGGCVILDFLMKGLK